MADDQVMSFGELKVEGAKESTIPFDDLDLRPRLRKVWRILPDDHITIFIHERACRAMVRQSFDNPTEEIGGLMLGGYYTDKERPFVVVEDVVAAQHVLSSSHSLKFTHETWGAMTRELAKRKERRRTVGWYHSHPKSAAFLSEDDQFIHHNFFNQPWQVAVVVSVRDQVLATFQWREDVLVGRCGYYLIEAPASE